MSFLYDCVYKDPSQIELFITESKDIYEAAKFHRDRCTQALQWLAPPFSFGDTFDQALDSEDCKAIIASLGVGLCWKDAPSGLEGLFRLENLRYGRIIFVGEPSPRGSEFQAELTRFFRLYLTPLLEGSYVYSVELDQPSDLGVDRISDTVLNAETRQLRLVLP